MEKIKLSVKAREEKRPNQLRREQKIPATLYGPGQPSENVQVDAKEFSRLPGAAYSHMIQLDFGNNKPVNAIIRDVQRKPTTHEVLNIEFYRVALDRKLTVTIPLMFVGESPAVAQGGQLIEVFQEAEIECFPGDIPDKLEVDLSVLEEIDQAIHFSDLKVSDKVKILNPLDEVVVRVVAKRIHEEEAPAAPEAAAAAEAPQPAEAAASA
ncbi:MAG TPA: 50S ribosomal protein L25 [Candidatus Obscuribacterales bacterium]